MRPRWLRQMREYYKASGKSVAGSVFAEQQLTGAKLDEAMTLANDMLDRGVGDTEVEDALMDVFQVSRDEAEIIIDKAVGIF